MKGRRLFLPLVAPLILYGVPWWALVLAPDWGVAGTIAGTALFVAGLATMPVAMMRGHGRRQSDAAARIGDILLATIWVLFTWSILGQLLRLPLLGVESPSRII